MFDATKDLAIVTVEKGKKTPLQRVLIGDTTREGLVSGTGTLTVTDIDGSSTAYTFNEHNTNKEITVAVGQLMQWHADGPTNLTFYEICEPPYEDGRFENITK